MDNFEQELVQVDSLPPDPSSGEHDNSLSLPKRKPGQPKFFNCPTTSAPQVVDWGRVFILSIYRGERFGASDEKRDLTSIVGRGDSIIDLTATRVANRLNARGFEATTRWENPSGTSPDATRNPEDAHRDSSRSSRKRSLCHSAPHSILRDDRNRVVTRRHSTYYVAELHKVIEGAVASPRAGFHDFMRRGGLDGLFARHSLKPIHRVRSHFGTIGIAVARKER